VSVDPPCVLVSLARNVTSFRAIAKLGYFGVSMVSRDQIDVVRRASAPGHPKYLDEESADRAVSDGGRGRHRNRPMPLSPMLTNAPFHFDCRVVHIHNSGDHGVIFAEVVKIRRGERDGPGTPLLYFDGRFHHLGAPLPAV
jgi:flavin reductase